MTPWYVYLGATVAVVSLVGTAAAIARRLVRWGRRVADSIERAVEVLDGWPDTAAAVERHTSELVELPLALGRIDGAQRKTRADVDELWTRWRARFPDERPLHDD